MLSVLARDPNALSSWFAAQLHGIGPQDGWSANTDSVRISASGTRDGRAWQFLLQQFQRPRESCTLTRWWALRDLARCPHVSVWLVQPRPGFAAVDWTVFSPREGAGLLTASALSLSTYRERYAAWWTQAAATRLDDTPLQLGGVT